MRDAQSLLDQVISFAGLEVDDRQVTELLGLVDRSLLYEMLAGLVGGEPARCLDAIAQVHDFGFEMDQFTAELLELLRNAALVAMASDARRHLDLSDDELDRLEKLSEGLSPQVFARWFDALLEIHDRVARAAQPRMVLEMAVARLATIRPVEGLDRVMARLEDLDRRLRQGGFRAAPTGAKRGGPPFPATGAEAPRREARRPAFEDTAPPPGAPQRGQPVARAPAAQPAPSPRERPAPVPTERPEPGPRERPEPAPRERAEPAPRERPEPLLPEQFAPPRGQRPEPPPPEPFEASSPPVPTPASGQGAQLFESPRRSTPPVAAAGPRPELHKPAASPPSAQPAADAEAEPCSALPLPEVGADDDTAARYNAVLDVLERVDLSWTSLVEHSVAMSWSGEELRVAFASQFQLEQGRPKVTGATLRPVLVRAFPGLARVEVVLREQPQGRPETRHEARKTARALYLRRLREEVEQDPILSSLRQRLGLVLDDFVPLDPTEKNHD